MPIIYDSGSSASSASYSSGGVNYSGGSSGSSSSPSSSSPSSSSAPKSSSSSGGSGRTYQEGKSTPFQELQDPNSAFSQSVSRGIAGVERSSGGSTRIYSPYVQRNAQGEVLTPEMIPAPIQAAAASKTESQINYQGTGMGQGLDLYGGQYAYGQTPFEQTQNQQGAFYQSYQAGLQNTMAAARYAPERLLAAYKAGTKEDIQQAIIEGVKKESFAKNAPMLTASALMDFQQAGLIISRTDAAGNKYFELSEKGRNLGVENFYKLEQNAAYGKSFDFIVDPITGKIDVAPEGTRTVISKAGYVKPSYVEYQGSLYLLTSKEGKDTITARKVDEQTQQLGPETRIPLGALYERSAFDSGKAYMSPNASYSATGSSYDGLLISGTSTVNMPSQGPSGGTLSLGRLSGADVVSAMRPKSLDASSAISQATKEATQAQKDYFYSLKYEPAIPTTNFIAYDRMTGKDLVINVPQAREATPYEKEFYRGATESPTVRAFRTAQSSSLSEKQEPFINYFTENMPASLKTGTIYPTGMSISELATAPLAGGAKLTQGIERTIQGTAALGGVAYGAAVATAANIPGVKLSPYTRGEAFGIMFGNPERFYDIPGAATVLATPFVESALKPSTTTLSPGESKLLYRESFKYEPKPIGTSAEGFYYSRLQGDVIPESVYGSMRNPATPSSSFMISGEGGGMAGLEGKGYVGFSTYREGTDAFSMKSLKDYGTYALQQGKQLLGMEGSKGLVVYGQGIQSSLAAREIFLPPEPGMFNLGEAAALSGGAMFTQAASNILSGRPAGEGIGGAGAAGLIGYSGLQTVNRYMSLPSPAPQSEIVPTITKGTYSTIPEGPPLLDYTGGVPAKYGTYSGEAGRPIVTADESSIIVPRNVYPTATFDRPIIRETKPYQMPNMLVKPEDMFRTEGNLPAPPKARNPFTYNEKFENSFSSYKESGGGFQEYAKPSRAFQKYMNKPKEELIEYGYDRQVYPPGQGERLTYGDVVATTRPGQTLTEEFYKNLPQRTGYISQNLPPVTESILGGPESRFITKTSYRTEPLYITRSFEEQLFKPSETVKELQSQNQFSLQFQPQQQSFLQFPTSEQTTIISTTGIFPGPTIFNPPPTPPPGQQPGGNIIPFGGAPGIIGNFLGGYAPGDYGGARGRQKGYKPSVTAEFFGIRNLKGGNLENAIFTGAEIRGLTR